MKFLVGSSFSIACVIAQTIIGGEQIQQVLRAMHLTCGLRLIQQDGAVPRVPFGHSFFVLSFLFNGAHKSRV